MRPYIEATFENVRGPVVILDGISLGVRYPRSSPYIDARLSMPIRRRGAREGWRGRLSTGHKDPSFRRFINSPLRRREKCARIRAIPERTEVAFA